jgi:hypothetical protein
MGKELGGDHIQVLDEEKQAFYLGFRNVPSVACLSLYVTDIGGAVWYRILVLLSAVVSSFFVLLSVDFFIHTYDVEFDSSILEEVQTGSWSTLGQDSTSSSLGSDSARVVSHL